MLFSLPFCLLLGCCWLTLQIHNILNHNVLLMQLFLEFQLHVCQQLVRFRAQTAQTAQAAQAFQAMARTKAAQAMARTQAAQAMARAQAVHVMAITQAAQASRHCTILRK